MPVCSDLTSQQRTASGVQIPAGGKVIVDAKPHETNCRYQGFSSWQFWNKTKVCDIKWQHQITFSKDIKWMNLNRQPLSSCTVSHSQPTTVVGWYTNSKVPQLHYQTGLDIVLPAMRCAPGKYSSSGGHFHCIQTRQGQMECLCKK